MGFWVALQFLTILPSPVNRDFTAEEVGQSVAYFPLVGLQLGLILWGADYLLTKMLMPGLPVDVLLVALIVILTGAMHVDGFIDTCDGAVARRTVQQRLDIMADSRVGAYGVVGGCLLLLLKVSAIVSLPDEYRVSALVLMPVLGRGAMVYSVFAYPYARKQGTGQAFKQGATGLRTAIATVTMMAIVAAVSRSWHGFVLAGVILLGVTGFCWYVKSRLGGLTGDSYGAANEFVEVLTLLALPVIWRAW